MNWLLFLAALGAVVANPFQSGLNAELHKRLGSPVWTTVVVYLSGLAGILLVQAIFRQPLPMDKAAATPWWAWLGGIVSIVSTIIGLTIAQRMGSGLFTGASLTASLVTSTLLDQFGLIGFRQHTASPQRMAGCALMIAGLWLIARF